MSTGYCITPIEKKWNWHINNHGNQSLYNRLIKYCIAVVETWAKMYIAIPQHGPHSLYIELESPSITRLAFYLPWSIILVDLQGLLHFHGHISWFVCKVVLEAALHHGKWKMAFSLGPTWWSNFHDLNSLVKKTIYKAFGPLARCKPKCGPRGMAMHQEVNNFYLFNICPKKAILKRLKYGHSLVCSCLCQP